MITVRKRKLENNESSGKSYYRINLHIDGKKRYIDNTDTMKTEYYDTTDDNVPLPKLESDPNNAQQEPSRSKFHPTHNNFKHIKHAELNPSEKKTPSLFAKV